MANVKFLRGQSSTLPSGNSIIDGALYVTLDSKRLFMGYDNGTSKELLPLAEGITTVTSVSSLPAAASHNGEFYYVSGSNILAWSNGTSWLQTNKDTQLVPANDTAISASDVTDGARVSMSVSDSDGNDVTGHVDFLEGSANVHISEENGAVEISVDDPITYELKSEGGASNNSSDNIALVLDPSSGADQKVALKNSASVKVIRDQSTGAISFAVDTTGVNGVASAALDAKSSTATAGTDLNGTGYLLKLTLGDGTELKDSINPTITYGSSANQTATFNADALTLNVPTTGELTAAIAQLEKDINAMIYRGTAASASAIPDTTPTGANGKYHNGDVYLSTGTFTIGGKSVEPGYLVIVKGPETDGEIPAASVTYDVVAGNDTDTTYTGVAISNGLQIQDSDTGTAAEISFVGGTAIALSDTSTASPGSSNVITINHDSVTRSDTADTAATQAEASNLTFTAVTAVTTNSQGHVTGVTTKSITVTDTHIDLGTGWTTTAAATTSSGVTTATVTQANDGDLGSMAFKLASSSLNVTASNDTVTLDLVWGTF